MRAFFIFLGLVLLAAVGWVWLTLTWSYSEGERAGYVQKFSRKGWLCKTWEGEIAMVTMPGAIPDRFEFTVRDDAVAQQINALAGKRIVLSYAPVKVAPPLTPVTPAPASPAAAAPATPAAPAPASPQ